MTMFDRSSVTRLDRLEALRSWPDLKAFASTVFRAAAILVVGATWIAFWALVMRLQLNQQEFLSAGVVGLLFVVPAIVGLGAYLGLLPERLIPS